MKDAYARAKLKQITIPAGTVWRNGSGVPDPALGSDNDFYINTINGDVYQKVSGSWILDLNLKGPQGPQGPAGGNGAQGVNGATWISGGGVPGAGIGSNGDFYINTSNYDYYSKSGGAWTLLGNFKGPQGPAGTAGPAGPAGTPGSSTAPLVTSLPTADVSLRGQTRLLQGITPVAEVSSLTINTAATVNGIVTVKLDNRPFSIAVTAGDAASTVASKIRAGNFPGWTTSGVGANVIFTSTIAVSRLDTQYSDTGTTGATGTLSVTTQGLTGSPDFLYECISSPEGTYSWKQIWPASPYTVDVRDWGAKGDGVTDDSAAFMRALNYMSSNMLGQPPGVPSSPLHELYIPGGIFLITIPESLLFRSYGAKFGAAIIGNTSAYRIRGAGRGISRVLFKPVIDPNNPRDEFLMYINDQISGVHISDISFETEMPPVRRNVTTLTITAPVTVDGTLGFTLNGTTYNVPIKAIDPDSNASLDVWNTARNIALGLSIPGFNVYAIDKMTRSGSGTLIDPVTSHTYVVQFDEAYNATPTTFSFSDGGLPEIRRVGYQSGATANGSVKITMNSIDFLIPVVAGDTPVQVAAKVNAASFTGWTTQLITTNQPNDTVKFTATTLGPRTGTYGVNQNGTSALSIDGNTQLQAGSTGTGISLTSAFAVSNIPQYNNSFIYINALSNTQNFVWDRVNWNGGWKRAIWLDGINLGSEQQFNHCGFYGGTLNRGLDTNQSFGFIDAFYIAPSANSQFLNYNFYDCQFEVGEGTYINCQQGGSVNIHGGSVIYYSGSGANAGTFFKLGIDPPLASPRSDQTSRGGGLGTARFYCDGVRMEMGSKKARLMDCYWPTGQITFIHLDQSSQSYISSNNVQNALFDLNQYNGPLITFQNCSLLGKHEYRSSHESAQRRIFYKICDFYDAVDPSDFIIYTNKDFWAGNGPMIEFDGCRTMAVQDSYRRLWDITLGWHQSARGSTKVKPFKYCNANGVLPYGTSNGTDAQAIETAEVFLPINAIVTGITFQMDPFNIAAANATGWNWTIATSEATPTVLASFGPTGDDANNGSQRIKQELLFRCNSEVKRHLVLTPSNKVAGYTAVGAVGVNGIIIVEYM